MKTIILCMVVLLSLAGCKKAAEILIDKNTSSHSSPGFVKYTIREGQQFCDGNNYKAISLSEMKFIVKFDSSAIYRTRSAENQYDINKLYGFSDNNSDHHQYSARIGWRWSDGALRLFAYVYNAGARSNKEITTVPVGADINCSIKVGKTSYIFTVNNVTDTLPRSGTTEKGSGYRLYPYFGGDETAPHEVDIWIKDMSSE